MKRLKLEKSHLVLAAVWLAVTPWFYGGTRPVALLVISAALLLAAFMVWRMPQPRALGRGILPVAYLGLLGWGGLSLIWSLNRFQTAVWLMHLAMAGVVFLLAYQFKDELWRRRWVAGYAALATGFSLWGIWLYITTSYERLTSSFYWANPWAIWVLPAMLLAFWYWANEAKARYLPAAVICGAAFWLADSRSSFLLLGLIVAVGAFRVRRVWPFWGRLMIATGLALALAGAVQVARDKQGAVTPSPGARLSELAGDSSSRTDRLYFLRSTLAIWRDHPLLGTGAGTFESAHTKYQFRVISASSHAHNYYAQTLSELGVVGLGLLLGVIYGVLTGAWRALTHNRRYLPLAVVVATLVIHLGLDTDSSYPALLLLGAAVAGMTHMPNAPGKIARYPAWLVSATLLLALPVGSYYLSDLSRQAGLAWQEEGEFKLAADHLRTAHSYLVYDPDVVTEEGINRYTQGLLSRSQRPYELALARERALEAARIDPLDAQHQFLLARIARLSGGAALAAYKQAINLDPYNDPEYYLDLASFYDAKLRPNEALATLSQVIQLYPEDVIGNRNQRVEIRAIMAHAHAMRANLYLLRGEEAAARADLEVAIRLNKESALAQRLLQQLGAR